MEAYEYATLREAEDHYWWFVLLHQTLTGLIAAHGISRGARICDAGCGTGGLVRQLRSAFGDDIYGFDVANAARLLWIKSRESHLFLGSINEIAIASDQFDAVISVDVLECDGVDPATAYGELWRIARAGGLIVLSLPAHRWLTNQQHDRAVGAVRRFSSGDIERLVSTRPAKLLKLSHFFGTFLPAIAAVRFAKALRDRVAPPKTPRSDIRPLPPWLNRLLIAAGKPEAAWIQSHDVPFGSSIVAVIRKETR